MNTKKQLRKLEDSLNNIRSITRVFEHVAAQKIDVNRNELVSLASHIKEAVTSYGSVKIAFSKDHKKQSQEILRTAMRVPVKRKVLVLVSSESKYFGNILNSLAQLFVLEFKQGGADAMIIGRIGRDMLLQQKTYSPQMMFYDFNDDKPDWNIFHAVSEELNKYQEIVIFYGKYKSILTQEAKREDISQAVRVDSTISPKKYVFEGGDKNALALLEKQIISSAFMQKLFESGLAKIAVAVKILEIGAIAERINLAFGQLAILKLRFAKDVNNRKQIQLYGSRHLWEKGGIFG